MAKAATKTTAAPAKSKAAPAPQPAQTKARTLDDVFADLARFDEIKQEAKDHILSEIESLDQRKRELQDKLVELGFRDLVEPEVTAEGNGKKKRTRKPMSEETRAKMKEAQAKRWAAKNADKAGA